ncbi:MAG: metal-dependent hydrolase [Candidatus Nanohaloarchaea archaeon]
MFPFSHFFTGYLIGFLLTTLGLVDLSSTTVAVFGILSLLPDADAIWHSKIKEHHKTLFHAPLFWIIISTLTLFESTEMAIIISSITLTHIFTDYITGRTVGIAFLYPIKDNEVSLYPLNDETASLNPVSPQKELLNNIYHFTLKTKNC